MEIRNAETIRNERAQAGTTLHRPKASAAIGACVGFCVLLLAVICGASAETLNTRFDPLTVYNGDWAVRAEHPWSAALPGAVDRLKSQCQAFTLYFACEQTVNGKPQALIVYTIGSDPGQLNTRTIAPNGLAGSRGDLTIEGDRWTYVDKPSAGLTGPWSRVENIMVDRNHIQFKEYESNDNGKHWTLTNSGAEQRVESEK